MTSQILTSHATEYSLPEHERLALLPPPKNSLKVKSVTKCKNSMNKKRKVKNND
jgi:hypothetical protein